MLQKYPKLTTHRRFRLGANEVKVPKLQSKYSRPLRQPLFKMARFQKWLLLMLLVTPIVLQLAQPGKYILQFFKLHIIQII